MEEEYKNYPFYDWVPKPLGIIFMIILFVPMITMSGVYSANSGEMMSGLGIQSEYIAFAGFCTSIGMAAFSPFFYELVCIRREKMMCIVGFSILFLLSFVCAQTDSLFILGLCSLLMGFVRQTLLMAHLFVLIRYGFGIEATKNITPGCEPTTEEAWDAVDSEKMVSQPVIYLFFMIIGQLGTWLTAWLAYAYEWQYVYHFMMAFMLAGIIIVFFTMPYHKYPMPKFPITMSKFGNVTVFSIMLCSFAYVMVFGKTLDAVIARAKNVHLKWMYCLGFLFIGGYALFMYFEVQNDGMYERMKWPIIIRSTGMMLLYSLISTIANQRMPYRFMSTWVCIMLTVRMVIAPCIGSALYTNVLQHRQQYYVTRFAQDYDRTSLETARTYDQTVRGMQYQGKTETEAQNMAAMSVKGKVQVQATLVSIKEMAGWTFYGCLVCAGLMLVIPWRKRNIKELTREYLLKNVNVKNLGRR